MPNSYAGGRVATISTAEIIQRNGGKSGALGAIQRYPVTQATWDGVATTFAKISNTAAVIEFASLMTPGFEGVAPFASFVSTATGSLSTAVTCFSRGFGDGACVTSASILGASLASANLARPALLAARPALSEFAASFYSGNAQMLLIDGGLTWFGDQ